MQAYQVGNKLKEKFPQIEIEYLFRESLGDKNQSDPLWKMPERGVFTEDFHQGLLNGDMDLVVHSWKDLPVEDRTGTHIACTLKRADVRDILLFKKLSLEKQNTREKVSIYSSSPRRAYNAKEFFEFALPFKLNSINFIDIRGNIQTRLRKYLQGEGDGLILAKAALDRILMSDSVEFQQSRDAVKNALLNSVYMILPLSASPAAAAQGALAVEIVSGKNLDLEKMLSEVNATEDFYNVMKERQCLATHGGGCHQKIGVTYLTRSFGEVKFMRGLTDQGIVLSEKSLKSNIKTPKVNADQAWSSRELNEKKFFIREEIPIVKPHGPNKYWISKAEAWPKNWESSLDDTYWVSGLESWKKLAQLGLWINGSSESLGEDENPRLEYLNTQNSPWIKLTHSGVTGSAAQGLEKNIFYTYKIIDCLKNVNSDALKRLHAKLCEKTHFYWSSGSAFLKMIEFEPSIISGFHGCGPGNTFEIINRYFRNENSKLEIFLNEEDWRDKVCEK
jgi:hydroxymethylbilane synthase